MSDKDPFEGNHASFRLAMCQVETEMWEVEANLERTLQALDEAATDGADLAICPEGVFHGYGSNHKPEERERLRDLSETMDGPCMTQVRAKAREHSMDVMVGLAERGDGEGVIHNSTAFIDGNGEVLNVYRKVHLRPFEDITREGAYTAGTKFEAADRTYGDETFRIGTMICFDREIPESVRVLRGMGSQFIACPLACGTSDMSKLRDRADNEMITQCRAAENEVFISVVSHAGRFNGGSFLVGPRGELMHQMGKDAGVKVLDVPVGIVPQKYHSNPLGWMGWGFRRPSVYEPVLGA